MSPFRNKTKRVLASSFCGYPEFCFCGYPGLRKDSLDARESCRRAKKQAWAATVILRRPGPQNPMTAFSNAGLGEGSETLERWYCHASRSARGVVFSDAGRLVAVVDRRTGRLWQVAHRFRWRPEQRHADLCIAVLQECHDTFLDKFRHHSPRSSICNAI